MAPTPRHFIDLKDIDAMTLRAMIDMAREMKAARRERRPHPMLAGRKLAMIFERNSTRTRVSFEAGMHEMGGQAINLSATDLQLGRGESVADTARVLSRYVDAIMMRGDHAKVRELAEFATVPVINGLTERVHPCQLMADILTFEEHRGPIRGSVIAWIGDGNNVANSWITAAVKFGFTLRLACPPELAPSPEYLAYAKAQNASVSLTDSPQEAVKDADAVTTDTWVSMGNENSETRRRLLTPFQVDEKLMREAKREAVFLHCLPAHRGEEVTAEVIDGPHSVVWDEAENRMHVQKAILHWCVGN
jgi:ornithine carbamoyltransferase